MQRLRRRLLGRLGGVVLVGKLWRFAWRGAPEQNAELLTYRPRPHARGVRTAKFSGRNLAVRKPEGDFGPAASGLRLAATAARDLRPRWIAFVDKRPTVACSKSDPNSAPSSGHSQPISFVPSTSPTGAIVPWDEGLAGPRARSG
jgi:hypothetical protein